MEFLFEFIFELIFEGISEASKSKRLPLFIRIIAASFIIILFLAVAAIVAFTGIIAIKDNILLGILLFIIDAVIIAAIIKNFLEYKKKR